MGFGARHWRLSLSNRVERLEPFEDLGWIDVDPNDYYLNPRENLRRLYRKFRTRLELAAM